MKKVAPVLIGFGAVIGLGNQAPAANHATQTVTYQVLAINELSVSDSPPALIVNAAPAADSQPTHATNSTTSYSITTNETGKKITARISSDMPPDVLLKADLAAPDGGTGLGQKTLTTTDTDLVTGITQMVDSGKTITYTLSATAGAGSVSSASKTVTLTLVAP